MARWVTEEDLLAVVKEVAVRCCVEVLWLPTGTGEGSLWSSITLNQASTSYHVQQLDHTSTAIDQTIAAGRVAFFSSFVASHLSSFHAEAGLGLVGSRDRIDKVKLGARHVSVSSGLPAQATKGRWK
jgi:hypothetical protein